MGYLRVFFLPCMLLISVGGFDDAIGSQPAAAEQASKQGHYISVGNLPLEGRYVPGHGLEREPLFEGEDKAEWERQLRETWGLDGFPSTVNGITSDGRNVEVRIVGTAPNEFGRLWRLEVESAGDEPESSPLLVFWTGDLDVAVRRQVPANPSESDYVLLAETCSEKGVELKHHLDGETNAGYGQIWYLDPLDANDRNDIADPANHENFRMDVVSPEGSPEVGLVACWYKSKTDPRTTYRGPVLAYDFSRQEIQWQGALDLDEHLVFLEIENDIYIVETDYCNACETSGFVMSKFTSHCVIADSVADRQKPCTHSITGRNRFSISGSASWFEGED
jgi:hypothetical protein